MTIAHHPTHDDPVDAMRPHASALVTAVANLDRQSVADLLTDLDTTSLHALAICLAAHADLRSLLAAQAEEGEQTSAIAKAVWLAAVRFNTTPDAICSSSRHRVDIDARMVAAYAAHLNRMTYSAIGRYVDKDHSTVMYAVTRVGEVPRLRRIAVDIATQLGWVRDQDEEAA